MMDIEQADRVHRVERLAREARIRVPQIDQLVAPQSGVPAVIVPFRDQSCVRRGCIFWARQRNRKPGTERILRVMADNMRNDVPDVRVTLLGHTMPAAATQATITVTASGSERVANPGVDGVNPDSLAQSLWAETTDRAQRHCGRTSRNRRSSF